MATYSDKLGTLVTESLKARGLSTRDVARLSDGSVSHQTIADMCRGVAPGIPKLVAVARLLGDDPNTYLEAAGIFYLRYVDEVVEAQRETAGRKPLFGAVGVASARFATA